ncbi:hypothetical protein [Paraburkholderia sp. MM5482-R1]|uniref:hypothetical protein n=1 Tax=unclassified Paraburkholderia TaxID=2615204 RepID=UPI003D2554C5
MAVIRWGALGALALVAGCSHSISGAYVARGQQFVELLQITQSPDGQLLGTLNHTAVKSDGSLERFTLNINGTTDGHAITLIGKANEPFSIPTNMSGTIDGENISIMQPDGIERFTKGNVSAYQNDIQSLGTQAVAIRQRNADRLRQQQVAAQETAREEALQHRVTNEDQYVATLADALNRYAAKVQEHHDLSPFHTAHLKILAAAQHDLEIERGYSRGSVPAAQVDTRINQLGVQLTQFDISYGQNVDLGRMHLQEFDAAIAKSPCHISHDALSNCSREQEAEAAYQDAKVIVQRETDDIEATIKRDAEAMKRIIAEANSIE